MKISLKLDQGTLILSVEDDGRGLCSKAGGSPPAVGGGSPRLLSGHGLTNMRSRLEEIGGRMEIESRPVSGTRVHFFVPLKAPA
jgi:signal transduction histidine kinase